MQSRRRCRTQSLFGQYDVDVDVDFYHCNVSMEYESLVLSMVTGPEVVKLVRFGCQRHLIEISS